MKNFVMHILQYKYPQHITIKEIKDEIFRYGYYATYNQIYNILHYSDVSINIVKHNTTPNTYSILL